MLSRDKTIREIVAYRLKLLALFDRFAAGEMSTVAAEAQECADALMCLMEDAPLEQRRAVDYLIDRYEALRSGCVS